ncbi:hypothetical protein [Neorickettsia sp. 179522]|uniref:hypothetical protein n=1 Tax=Neorickettsia sp. 179522 TaxID=1714371 RepID=UPI000A614C97|nr:hypothetical protein [Neorickettsia sp. 179522]
MFKADVLKVNSMEDPVFASFMPSTGGASKVKQYESKYNVRKYLTSYLDRVVVT